MIIFFKIVLSLLIILFYSLSDAQITSLPIQSVGVASTQTHSTNSTHVPAPQKEVTETFSLMMSDTEEKIISDALTHEKNQTDEATTCYYLSGIILMPPNWTLWLNGKSYTNESNIINLKITDVTGDRVSIKCKALKGKSAVSFKIDHTFCIDTGNVLAGDHRR